MPLAKLTIGQVINGLTALGPTDYFGPSSSGARRWEFRCRCGAVFLTRPTSVVSGKTKSCGCFHKQVVTTHGMTKDSTYRSWAHMLSRCYDRNNTAYRFYGGRGISVCARWHKFENFYDDMGPRPAGLVIDRKDTYGNYCPENCRWATVRQNANNTRSSKPLNINGVVKPISAWAEEAGLCYNTVWNRVKTGWSTSRLLIRPLIER